MKLSIYRARKDFVKYFTKSRSFPPLVGWGEEGDSGRIVFIGRSKEPSGVLGDEFVVGEEELGEELVGVRFVEFTAGVAPVDSVCKVVVRPISFFETSFGKAVGIFFLRFVEDDEPGLFGGLSGFSEISPEARFFDEVASAVIEISARFTGDLPLAGRGCRQLPHVSRPGGCA